MIALLLLLACTPDPGEDSEHPHDSGTRDHSWQLAAHPDPTVGSVIRLTWDQPRDDTVQVNWLDGLFWTEGPGEAREEGPQEALLLGVPYGASVELYLEGRQGRSETVSVTTDPLPEGLPQVDLLALDNAAEMASMAGVFTSSVGVTQGESWSIILDPRGRIVWALRSPDERLTLQPRTSRDGAALLIDHNSFYGSLDGGAASEVVGVTIDGAERARWATPGLHHGFAETDDGGIAWGATEGDGHDTVELIDAQGSQRQLWDCAPFFEGLGEAQACQNNGVSALDTGGFLVSLFATNSLVEISADGEPVRWFGHLSGAWSFEPSDSAFWWQHGAQMTEVGTLLLSTHSSAMSDEIVVREYALDADSETLSQIWSHGTGERLEAELGGDVLRLPGGNTLHGTGSAGRVREITPEGELVWEIDLEGTYLGRVSVIEDLYALSP